MAPSARELVEMIKQLLVLNGQQKVAARAQLKLVIQEALDIGLQHALHDGAVPAKV